MKDNNKALFLYTGLIFLVALVIILISMFGQNNFKSKEALPVSAPSGWGISEKAALISEENLKLEEENRSLKADLSDRDTKIETLTAENAAQAEVINNYNILLDCYAMYRDRKYEEAKNLFLTVNKSVLPAEVQFLYDELLEKIS